MKYFRVKFDSMLEFNYYQSVLCTIQASLIGQFQRSQILPCNFSLDWVWATLLSKIRSRSFKTFFCVDFQATLGLTNYISHVTNCGFSNWSNSSVESIFTLNFVYRIGSSLAFKVVLSAPVYRQWRYVKSTNEESPNLNVRRQKVRLQIVRKCNQSEHTKNPTAKTQNIKQKVRFSIVLII